MFPKKEPRKDGKALNWDVDPVESNTWFNGWIAGEMIGVLCHWNYRSVPCYFEITDGQLPCPHCRKAPNLHWNGYLPLYKDSHRPTVVVIREVSRVAVEKLKVHDAVRVAREKKKGSAITVTASQWARRFEQPKGWKGPPDIRRWLLTLWKEPDLEAWVLAHPYADGAEPPRPVEQIGDQADAERELPKSNFEREVLKAVLRQNGHHETAAKVPPLIGDVLPIANGVHRKKS